MIHLKDLFNKLYASYKRNYMPLGMYIYFVI